MVRKIEGLREDIPTNMTALFDKMEGLLAELQQMSVLQEI
jgi:hypothetical protein